MFKKLLYFFIAVFIAAFFVLVAVNFGRDKKLNGDKSLISDEQATAASLPPLQKTRIPISETIPIGTPKGTIFVRDFYKDPSVFAIEEDSFILDIRPEYYIIYYKPQSSFKIIISKAPFAAARTAAEEWLVNYLGVSKADVCKLKVEIILPITVDKNLGGRSYPLSFCSSLFQ